MTKERKGFDTNWSKRLADYSKSNEFQQYFLELKEKLEQRTPEQKHGKQKVFLFIGVPGTGKSKIAEIVNDVHPSVIISTDWIFFDELRDVIGDDYYKAYVYRRELAKHFLDQGYSIVLDSNLRKERDREKIYQIAQQYKADSVLINLECPLDVAAQRQTLKGGENRTLKEKKQGLERALKEIQPPTRHDHQKAKVIPLNSDQSMKKLSMILQEQLQQRN